METRINPLDGSIKLSIMPWIHQRMDRTRRFASHELMRPLSQLPVETLESRMIAMMVRCATGSNTPLDTQFEPLANLLFSLLQFLNLLGHADMDKLQRDVLSNRITSLAFFEESGLKQAMKDGGYTESEVINLMMFATASGGLKRSEPSAIAAFHQVIERPPEYVPSLEGMLADATYCRLCEVVLALLHTPKPSTEGGGLAGATEPGARASRLMQAGGRILGAWVAGRMAVADHLAQWVQHSWVVNAAFGAGGMQLHQAIEQYNRVRSEVGGFSAWPEGGDRTLLETRAAAGWPAATREPTEGEPQADVTWANPLVVDVDTTIIDLSPSRADLWVTMLWDASKAYQTALNRLNAVTPGTTLGGESLPPFVTQADHELKAARSGKAVPLVVPSDNVTLWGGGTWGIRKLGMSGWRNHTLASVIRHVRTGSDGMLAYPFHVFGSGESSAYKNPVITPVCLAVELDAKTTLVDKTFRSLARLWLTTERDLTLMCQGFAPDREAMGLRALAEALRFVGVLELISHTGAATTILPYARAWYHALDVTGILDSNNAFNLCEYTNGAKMTLRFTPFSAFPESALIHHLVDNLHMINPAAMRQGYPLMLWETKECGRAFAPIHGWAQAADDLLDIVLLPMSNDAVSRRVEVRSDQEERPAFCRRANAIVSVLGEADLEPLDIAAAPLYTLTQP